MLVASSEKLECVLQVTLLEPSEPSHRRAFPSVKFFAWVFYLVLSITDFYIQFIDENIEA